MTTPSPLPPIATDDDIVIDIKDVLRRLRRGLPLWLGLALLGSAVGVVFALVAASKNTPVIALNLAVVQKRADTGVVLPNGLAFQPDDLRSLAILEEALRRLGVPKSEEAAKTLQSRIAVNELIYSHSAKEREKPQHGAPGWPGYHLTEYRISLPVSGLPTELAPAKREQLLTEIAGLYEAACRRAMPASVSPVPPVDPLVELLKTADYPDYGPLITKGIEELQAQLGPLHNAASWGINQQLVKLTQVRLPLLLELAASLNLSKEPKLAIEQTKIQLHAVEREEQDIQLKEEVYLEMLDFKRARTPQPREDYGFSGSAMIDGLATVRIAQRQVRAKKNRLLSRISQLQEQLVGPSPQLKTFEVAFAEFKSVRDALAADVRKQAVARQSKPPEDIVRITQPATTLSAPGVSMIKGAATGSFLGLLFGLGVSLLRPYPATRRDA